MNDPIELQRIAADCLVEVRAYGMSEAVRSMVKLLDALEAQYKADFETVTVDNLVALQTAVKQIAALRRSITSERHLDPKIF